MKIKWFRSVRFQNDWELNFIGKVWNLRIARHQFALWRNYIALFNFCRQDLSDLRLGAGSLD
jgi:hypothetical protein